MDNYIAVVFDSDAKAAKGLHRLWQLDDDDDVTVHGAAVVRRDAFGKVQVATKDTDPGVRTLIGVELGAILGAVAGPLGSAAGAAAGAAATTAVATGMGIGAAAGGAVGLTADAVKSSEHEEAAFESGFVMRAGQTAVIAEISEDWTTPVDTAMKELGGTVYRRAKGDVRDDAFFGEDYLYPYDYEPHWSAS